MDMKNKKTYSQKRKRIFAFLSALFFLFSVFGIHSCAHDPFGLLAESLPWVTKSSEHFVFYYLPQDSNSVIWQNPLTLFDGSLWDPQEHSQEENIQTYLQHMENWYALFLQITGVKPPQKIALYHYSNKNQYHSYANGMAMACIDYAKMNGDGSALHMYLYPTIGHELFHVFQAQMGLNRLVFLEGAAVALASFMWIPLEDGRVRIVDAPSAKVADVKNPEVAYNQEVVEEGNFWFPLHMIAAMKLGLYQHEKYHVKSSKIHPGLRPSQVQSWANVFSRDQDIVYTIGGSFVHYLIEHYGMDLFVRFYQSTISTGLAGPVLEDEFKKVYKLSLSVVEDNWFDYLRSQPAQYWEATIYPLVEFGDS
jgi:hypothetical protein